METIEIKGLRIRAHHGVLESERRVGNIFELDIELRCDLSEAMATDSLDATINYAAVVDIVKREMAVPSDLLEHVLWRLRRAIGEAFPGKIAGGSIRLAKLAPPIAAELESVAVRTFW